MLFIFFWDFNFLSPAARSEEKLLFSQAAIFCMSIKFRVLNFAGIFVRWSLISRFFPNREKREIKSDGQEISTTEWQELKKNYFLHFLSINSFKVDK